MHAQESAVGFLVTIDEIVLFSSDNFSHSYPFANFLEFIHNAYNSAFLILSFISKKVEIFISNIMFVWKIFLADFFVWQICKIYANWMSTFREYYIVNYRPYITELVLVIMVIIKHKITSSNMKFGLIVWSK